MKEADQEEGTPAAAAAAEQWRRLLHEWIFNTKRNTDEVRLFYNTPTRMMMSRVWGGQSVQENYESKAQAERRTGRKKERT